MTNFSINFLRPWLLLLLIPAALMTLIPYFRMNKRYRGTRNRIVSMVVHCIVMVLSISVLAGTTIEYDIPNEESEVILVVDSSFSSDKVQDDRDEFVQAVINSNNSMFKLGIVTFGFDQVYAVPLTDNMSGVYNDYLQAPLPDVTATDIEAALKYAATLFEHPDNARIVLISDAFETDGKAVDVVKSIAASGIKVDTVHISEDNDDDEVQIIGMLLPDTAIKVAEPFEIELQIQSSVYATATITPYDNDAAGPGVTVELKKGIQTVKIPFTFEGPELHKMSFEITVDDDTLKQNNEYTSYINVENYNNLLIIESIEDESAAIVRMLSEEYVITVVQCDDYESMPSTLDGLRKFDEVLLCNISNDDMPDGFIEILHTYVQDIGGGLFTVCGNDFDSDPSDETWQANAYTKDDMKHTLYQKLLPVEIIDYTPPVAVFILIDSSGSMVYDKNGNILDKEDPNYEQLEVGTKLYFAKQGAEGCLDALSDRDYMGVYTFAEYESEELALTPCTQRDKIITSVHNIKGGGGTIFSSALESAGKALRACSNVEKRHIIIISDGEPNPDNVDLTKAVLEENAQYGITTSIIGIQSTGEAASLMKTLLTEYAGMEEENFYPITDPSMVAETIRDDITAPSITDVNYETFVPTIKTHTSITKGIAQEDIPELDGFYGMKAKDATEDNELKVILSAKYTPVYTYWKYGEGRVGTFACDLNGNWSSQFIDTDVGTTLLRNMMDALRPTRNIRIKNIDVELEGENYKTQLNIYTDLLEGETIEVKVVSPLGDGSSATTTQTLTAGATDSYTKMHFAVTTSGIHEIIAVKKSATGEVLATTTEYKALAYSKEYDAFRDAEEAEQLMVDLAEGGRGNQVTDPWQIYDSAALYLHKVIDPMIPFIISVIALFLMDIAVRKFKWKWPHEIIRDRKAKAEMSAGKR